MIRYVAFGPHARAEATWPSTSACSSIPRPTCAPRSASPCRDMDLWHAVASITVPTLVIAGDSDRLTPPAHARRIAEALPHPAGLLELPETGHMSPLERPREVSQALQRLIRETASARVAAARRTLTPCRRSATPSAPPTSAGCCARTRSWPRRSSPSAALRRSRRSSPARSRSPPASGRAAPIPIDDGIGLLVLEGVMLHRVGIDGRFGAELVGEGDVLRAVSQESTTPRCR